MDLSNRDQNVEDVKLKEQQREFEEDYKDNANKITELKENIKKILCYKILRKSLNRTTHIIPVNSPHGFNIANMIIQKDRISPEDYVTILHIMSQKLFKGESFKIEAVSLKIAKNFKISILFNNKPELEFEIRAVSQTAARSAGCYEAIGMLYPILDKVMLLSRIGNFRRIKAEAKEIGEPEWLKTHNTSIGPGKSLYNKLEIFVKNEELFDLIEIEERKDLDQNTFSLVEGDLTDFQGKVVLFHQKAFGISLKYKIICPTQGKYEAETISAGKLLFKLSLRCNDKQLAKQACALKYIEYYMPLRFAERHFELVGRRIPKEFKDEDHTYCHPLVLELREELNKKKEEEMRKRAEQEKEKSKIVDTLDESSEEDEYTEDSSNEENQVKKSSPDSLIGDSFSENEEDGDLMEERNEVIN